MSSPQDFAASVQATVAAVASSATDPADALRLLAELAGFSETSATASSVVGQSVSDMQNGCLDLFRRAAVVMMAKVSAKYQPSSVDDAAAVRSMVCDLLDAEITIAGDQGEDSTFNALRQLRAAVANDLTKRAVGLPGVTEVTTKQAIPAPVLAQRLYRDSSRADQLVIQSDCVHPAFMPTSFKALAE